MDEKDITIVEWDGEKSPSPLHKKPMSLPLYAYLGPELKAPWYWEVTVKRWHGRIPSRFYKIVRRYGDITTRLMPNVYKVDGWRAAALNFAYFAIRQGAMHVQIRLRREEI